MPESLEIHPMLSDEWVKFNQLDRAIFEENDQVREEYFHQRVQKPGFFAMNSQDGHLLGYLVLGRFSDKIAHLGRIGVQKSMQSQGLGAKLMEYALDWFRKQEGVKVVRLYTQVDNLHAQELYKKFGFKVSGHTWHYFVPFTSLQALGGYSLLEAQPNEFQTIAELFPASLPLEAIQNFIKGEQLIYALKDSSNSIVGACRFTPSFPGCFPFELTTLSSFDDFVLAFQPLCNPPSDFLRITFHENQKLATLCETRGYHLHHKLYQMQLILSKKK
ncbi:MAG: GNAT family N-acetyltransferase [Promethearchaeota archaeon]